MKTTLWDGHEVVLVARPSCIGVRYLGLNI